MYLEEGYANKKFICSKNKKNIFLIGDSIRIGYCETVKKELAEVANVFYIDDNCRNTQYVITSMYTWGNLFDAPELVDIVHFNCGHWDIAHWKGLDFSLTSKEEYERNLKMIVTLIKKIFINAKVILATTTPMNPNGMVGLNTRTNDEIDKYNLIAKEISEKTGIIISDLNEYTRDWSGECYRDYCHFTNSSYEVLGKEVARRLAMNLNN